MILASLGLLLFLCYLQSPFRPPLVTVVVCLCVYSVQESAANRRSHATFGVDVDGDAGNRAEVTLATNAVHRHEEPIRPPLLHTASPVQHHGQTEVPEVGAEAGMHQGEIRQVAALALGQASRDAVLVSSGALLLRTTAATIAHLAAGDGTAAGAVEVAHTLSPVDD